jgi:chorismate mutase
MSKTTPASSDEIVVPDIAAGRAALDEIDAGIRDLLNRRIAVSKQVQALRRQDGKPGIQHGRENEVIAGYVDQLGDPGADIALAVLQLCRGRLG